VPPSGLSGMLRRMAFKYGEGSFGHWLPLLLADRINVVEGLASDLMHGHIPNYFAEKGWNAEWKYNRKSAVKKLLMGTILASVVMGGFLFPKHIISKHKKKKFKRGWW
jgi:hypothetical protein